MGINPAVAFTTLLLALMVGAGVVSASYGYAVGRQALMGVKQPDSRPASAAANRAQRHAPMLRSEQDIVADVEARMSGGLPEVSTPPASN